MGEADNSEHTPKSKWNLFHPGYRAIQRAPISQPWNSTEDRRERGAKFPQTSPDGEANAPLNSAINQFLSCD
jgi:hypothetical protein